MSELSNDDVDKLTRQLSQSCLKLVDIYGDASKSVEETESAVKAYVEKTEHEEELFDRVLAMNGIEKPPEGVCPVRDLNDQLVEATEARGSDAADGIKAYMKLFRKACDVAKSKHDARQHKKVLTEDYKEVDMGLD